jgi:uncharacterized damage-inducible protein DinB
MRFLLCLLPALLMADDVVTKNLKTHVETYRGNILAAAEKIAPGDYTFKPSPDVMSIHEMLGHMTDANYGTCASVKGETNPDKGGNAKANPSKEAVIAALSKSFDYCVDAITASDGKLADQTKTRVPRDKAWFALHILDHVALHYGNLITYMRIKGLVPPETERRLQAAPAKK